MHITLAADRRPAATPLLPAEPLWKRVPLKDRDGTLLTDFMMIIPRLRQRPQRDIETVAARIAEVLAAYGESVVFADLNLRLNVLWVSVRPVPGICIELPAAIKLRVPEALLVSQRLAGE